MFDNWYDFQPPTQAFVPSALAVLGGLCASLRLCVNLLQFENQVLIPMFTLFLDYAALGVSPSNTL